MLDRIKLRHLLNKAQEMLAIRWIEQDAFGSVAGLEGGSWIFGRLFYQVGRARDLLLTLSSTYPHANIFSCPGE